MTPFDNHGDIVTALLREVEIDLLRDLAEQLIALLRDRATADHGGTSSPESADTWLAQLGIGGSESPPEDPALARLLPDAYRNDRVASSDHRRLTELGLVERKIASAHALITTLDASPVEISEAAAQSWLRTLNDLRLTLAARLQLDEGDERGTGDENMLGIYDWLGYLQGTLLDEIERMAPRHE